MTTQTPNQPQTNETNVIKVVLIVVGSVIAGLFLLMTLSIVAVTMLGRNADAKLDRVASQIR